MVEHTLFRSLFDLAVLSFSGSPVKVTEVYWLYFRRGK